MRRFAISLCVGALALPACTSHDDVAEGPQESLPETITPVRQESLPAADRVAPAPPGLALAWVRANECGAAPPMSLTASDGTGLRLVSIEADAVVEGPLAFTQMHLVFANPEPRQLEGRFGLRLPPGAALSRFAMAIDDRWQEGEVVERRAAQAAYEDFLHRKQDPALLEHDAGNRFEARVFPIPAGGKKELTIAWSQQLASAREPWVLPVCGLPELDELDVRVLVRGTDETDGAPTLFEVKRHESKFAPTQDLELRTGGRTAPVVRAGELVVARVVPQTSVGAAPLDRLAILFDTSASRSLDFAGQLTRLEALVGELRRRHPALVLRMVAFDQAPEVVFEGPIADFAEPVIAKLRERGAFGATDFVKALPAVHGFTRVLIVGDGIVTAGVSDRRDLMRVTGGTAGHGVQRIDALVDGGLQDSELFAEIVREPADDGVVLDARATVGHIVDRLEKRTASGLQVNVPGATWTWPATLDGVADGDEVLVYAKLPADAPLRVEIDGDAIVGADTPVWSVPAPLVRRAHGQARIVELQRQLGSTGSEDGEANRAALVREIVAVSTRERVLSDYTALLVLETEDDYRRFGIERTAMADILAVGDRGIDVLQRAPRLEVAQKNDEPEHGEPRKKKLTMKSVDLSSALDGGESNEDKGSVDAKSSEGDVDLPRGHTSAVTPTPSRTPSLEADNRPAPSPADPYSGSVAEEGRWARDESRPERDEAPPTADPYDGELARVMKEIAAGRADEALAIARAWHERAPGEVLALVALGEAYEAKGDLAAAARAYGSLVDLHPSRADIRRMAGERLERLGGVGRTLAIDTYEKAVAQRPDHPSGRRLLAYALVQDGRHEEAFHTIEAALDQPYPGGRFAEVNRILREDLGLVAAAWLRADPDAEATIAKAVGERRVSVDHRASVRFVLVWETDANDVDLHVWDRRGGHAFYQRKDLPSGGQLYADVTTGYGPEVFAIDGEGKAGPYRVRAHYYARGPMGYGMGKLQVIEHDGAGALSFSEHPFVIMKDQAHVDLVEWKPKR
jgi:hypothetical protein